MKTKSAYRECKILEVQASRNLLREMSLCQGNTWQCSTDSTGISLEVVQDIKITIILYSFAEYLALVQWYRATSSHIRTLRPQ